MLKIGATIDQFVSLRQAIKWFAALFGFEYIGADFERAQIK